MNIRAALAFLVGLGITPAAQAQFGQNPFNLPDLKLPLSGLGNTYLPPLPGQPMGAFLPPPGTNMLNGQYSPLHNAWGAQTPWPFQNPFTPAHWNYQGMNGYGNPWLNSGMWTGPPFGQYGYNGVYQGFAPIVGANNGWFPYDAGWGGNPWMGGMGYGGFGMTGMGMPGMGMGMGNGLGGPMMPGMMMPNMMMPNMMMPNMMFPR
jgi:hypothetical protein